MSKSIVVLLLEVVVLFVPFCGTITTATDRISPIVVTANETCPPPFRTCDSGEKAKCYPEDWMCDGHFDCEDKSDEPDSCQRVCTESEYSCVSGICLPRRFLCDGQNDCGTLSTGQEDLSDEHPALCNQPLRCAPNEYSCKFGAACIHMSKFCDGVVDCNDGSDEHSKCASFDKQRFKGQCKYGIANTLDGLLCYCPGKKVYLDGECVSQKACSRTLMGDPPACTQTCKDKPDGEFECSCADPTLKLVNGSVCASSLTELPKVAVLLENAVRFYGSRRESQMLALRKSDLKYIFNELPGFAAADGPVVCHRNLEDYKVTKLVCSSLDSKKKKMFEIRSSLEMVSFLRFDIIGMNWILSDGEKFITMCKHEDVIHKCAPLRVGLNGEMKDLQVDPVAGLVFFSLVGGADNGVWRIRMADGEEKKLSQPTATAAFAIAVDPHTRTVYYLDRTLDYVRAIDYDGKTPERIIIDGHQTKIAETMIYAEGKLFLTTRSGDVLVYDVTQPRHQDAQKVDQKVRNAVGFVYLKKKEFSWAGDGICEIICNGICVSDGNGKGACVCQEGEVKMKSNCESSWDGHTSFLAVARMRPSGVMALSIPSEDVPESRLFGIRTINDVKRPSALTIDQKGKRILTFDSKRHSLLVNKIGRTEVESVTMKGFINSEGIAYDYTSDIVYFTDEGRLAIVAVRLSNPEDSKVIVRGNMTSPRSIVVFAQKSYIFWGSWSERNTGSIAPKIERARLDGSDRKTLVSKGARWINGLAVDPVNEYLYFCDAYRNVIERIRFNGADRERIVEGAETVIHPYGLVFHNNHIFWTEYKRGLIKQVRVLEKGIGHVKTVYNNSYGIFEMSVFDESKSLDKTSCSIDNGGCEQFCFSNSCKGSVGCEKVKCGCRDGQKNAPNDPKKCIPDADFVDVDDCNDTEFKCVSNGRCISKASKCDGDKDCEDGSDEDMETTCKNFTCRPDTHRCDKTSCIPKRWLCDGSNECDDFSDESAENCPPKDAKKCEHSSPFYCTADLSTCVPKLQRCDGINDCENGADEVGCIKPKCDSTQFRCGNGDCIEPWQVCDGFKSCRDGLDEAHCREGCVDGRQFRCNKTTPCMDLVYKCDGFADCDDGADEKQCLGAVDDCTLVNSFKCADGKCIRAAHVCDGFPDCLSGEDELDCPASMCSPATGFTCLSGKRCIDKDLECDGVDDCGDGSDESHCEGVRRDAAADRRCQPPNYRCASDTRLICISEHQLCDGTMDCPAGDDEAVFCEKECDAEERTECRLTSPRSTCRPAPWGTFCSCPEGMARINGVCTKEDPCTFGRCSQKCVRHGATHTCHCYEGYKLQPDNFTCTSEDSQSTFMLYTARHEIRQLMGSRPGSTPVLSRQRNTIALDYKFNQNGSISVFWSDLSDDRIMTGLLENNVIRYQRTLAAYGVESAESLAVDWLTGNVYWVDSNLDTIDMINGDGTMRATVVSKGIANIRALTLDSAVGLMFWTDWEKDHPRIERSTMAGEERQIIWNVTKVSSGGWPNGIACDTTAQRLYWVDAKSDTIHTITYEGDGHVEILRSRSLISHPFSVDVFENFVYFSDWKTFSISRVNKWTGGNYSVVERTTTQPFTIKIVHRGRQPRTLKNPCHGVSCHGVCLLNGPNRYKCLCPNMKRETSQGTCDDVATDLLIVATEKKIYGVAVGASKSSPPFPMLSGDFLMGIQAIAAVNEEIYVLDSKLKYLIAFNITSNKEPRVVVSGDLNDASGLAAADTTEAIYLSKSSGIIEAVNQAGTVRATVQATQGRPRNLLFLKKKRTILWMNDALDPPGIHLEPYTDTSSITTELTRGAYNLMEDPLSGDVFWLARQKNNVTRLVRYNLKRNTAAEVDVNGVDLRAATFDEKTGDLVMMIPEVNRTDRCAIQRWKVDEQQARKLEEIRSGMLCDSKSKLTFYQGKSRKVETCEAGFMSGLSLSTCLKAKGTGVKKRVFYLTDGLLKSIGLDGGEKDVHVIHSSVAAKKIYRFAVDPKRKLIYLVTKNNEVYRATTNGSSSDLIYSVFQHKIAAITVDLPTGNVLLGVRPAASDEGFIVLIDPINDIKSTILEDGEKIPYEIQVDSVKGKVFWASKSTIKTALMDGSQPREIVQAAVTSLGLDRKAELVCYGKRGDNDAVHCSDYEGKNEKILVEFRRQGLGEDVPFTIENDHLLVYDKFQKAFSHWIRAKNGSFVKAADDVASKTTNVEYVALMDEQGKVPFTACSNQNGGCEHLCIMAGDVKKCICVHEQLAPNGTCIPHEALLVYTSMNSLEFSNAPQLHTKTSSSAPAKSINTEQCFMIRPKTLAVDNTNRRIFFADSDKMRISVVDIDGTNCTVVAEGVANVEGMSYDEKHGDLYFTRSAPPAILRIHVANDRKKSIPEIVLSLVSFIDNPLRIVVHPCRMLIFFINDHRNWSAIELVYFSGFGRKTIVEEDVKRARGLAIDFTTDKLYFTDIGESTISRCDLDGSHLETIIDPHNKNMVGEQKMKFNPLHISIYNEFILVTDYIRKGVYVFDKLFPSAMKRITSLGADPGEAAVIAYDVVVCKTNLCDKTKLGCEDSCRLDVFGVAECVCDDNRRLNADNKTCTTEGAGKKCALNEFKCLSSDFCLPYEETCDGVVDCVHGDDEDDRYCASRKCRAGFFACGNGMCIAESKKCNRVNDCVNQADEVDCPCTETEFKCEMGTCIPAAKKCDMTVDCADGSDEKKCPPVNCTAIPGMPSGMIPCKSSNQCYHPSWRCDLKSDCADGSDETDCPSIFEESWAEQQPRRGCKPAEFKCATTSTCMPRHWVCDGQTDCADNSDEANCAKPCLDKFEYTCRNSKSCIGVDQVCDGNSDCPDGEDEKECERNECHGEGNTTFRCTNHRCIPIGWVCDGTDDCMDNAKATGSDEMNCVHKMSLPGKCSSGSCEVPCELTALLCDGIHDCEGGFDEKNCTAIDRTCGPDKWMCNNGQCVRSSEVCDTIVQCIDGSDEWPEMCPAYRRSGQLRRGCNAMCMLRNGTLGCVDHLLCDRNIDCAFGEDERRCANLNTTTCHRTCDHFCHGGPFERCDCRPGYHLNPFDKTTCLKSPSCPLANCSHSCIDRPTGHQCICAKGYILAGNGHDCKRKDGVEPELVLVYGHQMKLFTLDGHSKATLLDNLTSPVAVDFDSRSSLIYFTDMHSNGNKIGIVSMNGQPHSYKIISGLPTRGVDGMAVDWLGRNVYYTDKHQDCIAMCDMRGRFHKVLLKGEPLSDPRAIVLDPVEGIIFWSDWGASAHIGRMNMDGSQVKVLLQDPTIRWPNALAVDPPARRLYFGDADRDYIGYCDYDGSRRRTLLRNAVRHIFALFVFDDFVYWSDWHNQTVERAHKILGDQRKTIIHDTKYRPMGFKIIHPGVQKMADKEIARHPCSQQSRCENLCVPSDSPDKFSCMCAQGFRAIGRSCQSECRPLDMVCSQTFKCIPRWWRCDGQDDCGDGEDEGHFVDGVCPPFHCKPGEFSCAGANSTCLYTSQLCDGHPDCPDGDDEKIDFCRQFDCGDGHQKCADGSKCIPTTEICDGRINCADGSDERSCQECGPDFFTCRNDGNAPSTCIPIEYYCDGQTDCPKGQDEPITCALPPCHVGQFKCASGKCIADAHRCDGVSDCRDGSDELGCETNCAAYCKDRCFPIELVCDGHSDWDCGGADETYEACDRKFATNKTAWTAQCVANGGLACKDGLYCYSPKERCDGVPHCPGADDEADCPACAETVCKNGFGCVKTGQVCDGVADCADGSDEAFCERHSENDVSCGRQWIPEYFLCDGTHHCEDGSDENCSSRPPCKKMHMCADRKQCFAGRSAQCDGIVDCVDGSDEDPALCSLACLDGFRCLNGRCIDKTGRCDRRNDCGDWSDEDSCDYGCGRFGACSQHCRLDRNNATRCFCAPGFRKEHGSTCLPEKNTTDVFILVGGYVEWFFLPSEDIFEMTRMPVVKVDATSGIDFSLVDDLTVFTTHIYSGRTGISHFRPDRHLKNQILKDDLWDINTEYSKEYQKTSLAYDYLHENFYYTEPVKPSLGKKKTDAYVYHDIYVSRRDRETRHRLVNATGTVSSMALAPEEGLMFWTTQWPIAAVFSARLDGSVVNNPPHLRNWTSLTKHKPIVMNDVIRPVSLTVDLPNGRIYWIDEATRAIESTRFDGWDRVTRRFPKGQEPIAMDLDVDELLVLFADSSKKLELFRVHKFTGVRTPTGLNISAAATAVKVAHSGKQKPHLTDFYEACESSCPTNSVCLPGGYVPTCACAAGEFYEPSTKKCMRDEDKDAIGDQCFDNICYNNAYCSQSLKGCICPPGFAGRYCEISECAAKCWNGAKCAIRADGRTYQMTCNCSHPYSDETCTTHVCDHVCGPHGVCTISPCSGDVCDLEASCKCDAGWAGERCDRPKDRNDSCDGFCFNNGTCWRSKHRLECDCADGYNGARCDRCDGKDCGHGTCIGNVCHCPPGFQGDHCEEDMCAGKCPHLQKCVYDPTNSDAPFKCLCSPAASQTNKDCAPVCNAHPDWCLNGGRCEDEPGRPGTCYCSPRFGGARCEQKLKCSDYCLNGATCRVHNSTHFGCECPPTHTGLRCEQPASCDGRCDNGATCRIEANATRCVCPKGLSGDRCSYVSATSCGSLECSNGGICTSLSSLENSLPACICPIGWDGLTCNQRTCSNYCANGGRCELRDGQPHCWCLIDFYGTQCQISRFGIERVQSSNWWKIVLTAALLITLSLLLFVVTRSSRAELLRQFRHAPLQEVQMEDFSNGAYVTDDAEVAGDERTHFTNPTFEGDEEPARTIAYNAANESIELLK